MQTIRHTTKQAAARLGIDDSIVRKYCREGRLGERIGRNFSITEDDLRTFIERRKAKPRFGRPPKQPKS